LILKELRATEGRFAVTRCRSVSYSAFVVKHKLLFETLAVTTIASYFFFMLTAIIID